jgi:hypothetical protein
MNPHDDPEGVAFALLDLGYTKEEAAAEAGMSVEVLDACLERWDSYLWLRSHEH